MLLVVGMSKVLTAEVVPDRIKQVVDNLLDGANIRDVKTSALVARLPKGWSNTEVRLAKLYIKRLRNAASARITRLKKTEKIKNQATLITKLNNELAAVKRLKESGKYVTTDVRAELLDLVGALNDDNNELLSKKRDLQNEYIRLKAAVRESNDKRLKKDVEVRKVRQESEIFQKKYISLMKDFEEQKKQLNDMETNYAMMQLKVDRCEKLYGSESLSNIVDEYLSGIVFRGH